MRKNLIIPVVFALVLGTVTLIWAIPQEDAKEEKIGKAVCLACHGSFDDLAAATADYKAPSGETVTPHRYVPHEEKTDIPECVECHKPHPIPPPESKEEVVNTANIDWCYASCHHTYTLESCYDCH